jgi:L,D-peptidoglycan transpeptidase YkuD (ErfK/YbiS/YcfS/YnhG family)
LLSGGADDMRRIFLRNIEVRALPGRRSQGLMQAGPLTVPVVLGRGGIKADKREGDGGTPRGRFRTLRLWWRADRLGHPRTLLPTRRITREVAWSEDPADRNYNRPVTRSANEPGDRLWRSDGLYDLFMKSTITCGLGWPAAAARFSSTWRGRVLRPPQAVWRCD